MAGTSVSPRYISAVSLLAIFVDEWNYFSVPMLSAFIERGFHLGSLAMGLVTSAVIGGAAVGSLAGGYLTDALGRKRVFLLNMVLFAATGISTLFVRNFASLLALRAITGFPVGADLASGYAFLMETIRPGRREVTGTMNTLMASFAILSVNTIALLMMLTWPASAMDWRVPMALSALPALAGAIMVLRVPETGQWRERMEERVTFRAMFRSIFSDQTRRRASVFSWISGAASTLEVGTFAFFIPVIVSGLGITGPIGSREVTIAIYSFGVPAGIAGPLLLPRLGLRKVSTVGYASTIVSLVGAGLSLVLRQYLLVPLFALLFVWGNHWNSQPTLTSQSMVADTGYRGKATGFSNFISLLPTFVTVSLFQGFVHSVGLGLATLAVSLAPAAGLLSSVLVFREIYGYSRDLVGSRLPGPEEGAARLEPAD
ncbi:MFS transporter [Thermogymnomonas acidicola]|uniref:MFS transporter n=1 Tax=Thermogymnomonas acidicola TaxID=399579 RepID=A0AA37BRY9_9ARCH|nr:MFS transporter [Thermogymnomonas acidicola]GGM76503.1 MFS transporter [Thermogymnomonas acidicola]